MVQDQPFHHLTYINPHLPHLNLFFTTTSSSNAQGGSSTMCFKLNLRVLRRREVS
jgi:hypothetical protein